MKITDAWAEVSSTKFNKRSPNLEGRKAHHLTFEFSDGPFLPSDNGFESIRFSDSRGCLRPTLLYSGHRSTF